MKNIVFIGLGAMGTPMAACLVRSGFVVKGFDLEPQRMATFVQKYGGKEADCLHQACREAEAVVLILPNSAVVKTLLVGDQGIVKDLKPGCVVIDMTSGLSAVTIALHHELARQGIAFFDAPVSGAVPRAVSGDLTIMVGGEDHIVQPAMEILCAMGQVTRTGAIGSGDVMKALNNLVSCGGYLIGIEALLIGTRFGLSPEKILEVLNASTGMNNSTQKKFEQYVLSRKFNSGFPIHMMLKDLDNAVDLGHQLGVTTPFSQLCRDLWASASTMLGSDVDHTAVAWLCEVMAGSKIIGHTEANDDASVKPVH